MAKARLLDDRLKYDVIKLIDSNNLNFLIGSGFSADLLKTLGNLEKVMEIIKKEPMNVKYRLLEALLYWHFFEVSVYPMVSNITTEKLSKHIEFTDIWKLILSKRDNSIYQKQLNIFTTNYDVVLEYSMENSFVDYNDGFSGRINPYFTTSNYNKVYYKQALFSNRRSELPMFNLFKLHGSITWKKTSKYDDKFVYGNYVQELETFYQKYKDLVYNNQTENGQLYSPILTSIDECKWEDVTKEFIDSLIENLEITPEKFDLEWKPFIEEYKSVFKIVNPTKEKFSDTLVDKNYYELLRIYCNELERENTLLLVYGFSFNDEHIEDITKRALNNPSLLMIIFSYTKKDKLKFMSKFSLNSNVWVVGLEEWDIPVMDNSGESFDSTPNNIPEQLIALDNFYDEEHQVSLNEVNAEEQAAVAVESYVQTQTTSEPVMDISILNTFFKKLI